MRNRLIFTCCFVFAAVWLQAQRGVDNIIRVQQLPKEGILLDKGWKFQAGDNPEYSNPSFDDRHWKPIDPTKDIHDIPELWKTNIGWFRLHVVFDSSTTQKTLAVLVGQTGASEIFLNGQLIQKFGTISSNPEQVQAIMPTRGTYIELPVSKEEQVIAVRFAVQKNLPYLTFAGRSNSALVLRAMEVQSISRSFQRNFHLFLDYMRGGLFLILAVLHLALFWFNTSQKANLYFFLYSFLASLVSFLVSLVYTHVYLASTKQFIFIAVIIGELISLLFFLSAVYNMFNYRRGVVYWLLVIGFFISFVMVFINYNSGDFIVTIFPIVVSLEYIRITVLAAKEKRRGAKIAIAGAAAYLLTFFGFLSFFFGYLPSGPNGIYAHLAYNVSFLVLPVSISIYLALEASYTSRSLQEKLKEVQQLSAKTIEQEQEKQLILASQKEILKKQVEERTIELKQSLEDLKATQSQLVQREKMASLGELTAGIAHEIQNPLNFVNNFSDVNAELIEELKEQLATGNGQEAMMIANDIKENEQKINHHGKRADAIVKGMLEHSRTNTGKKELTDINGLAGEYLRLSYQGLRAKDKSFNADFKTEFDESIGKVEVVPHDIGRVLLNLINNAFYAVNEKKRQLNGTFEPVVSVSTKRVADKVEITVKDNGIGVPQKVVDKIFQPFFTTKPTGQGTGLGLSLSYDIIKAHGGELKVESKEGEGAEFIIQLPVSQNIKSNKSLNPINLGSDSL
jgi:signal transduction histidine kinase